MVVFTKNLQYKRQQATLGYFSAISITKSKKTLWQRFCGVVFLTLLPFFVFAQGLSVTADRQQIEMGDIITLYVKADFQTRGSQLNLDDLQDQFEILGRQQSNNIQVINGSITSNTSWQITLLAKQIGELIVPPLRLGDVMSQPYTITVTPVKPKSATETSSYFIESSLSKSEVYIQEEVVYSLKLNFLGNFTGSVRPPIFENALSEVLKDQNIYGKRINGEQYTVYEWQYALYPQQSGELTITGPLFSGIHRYRGQQKGIQEMAQSQTIKVLAEPADFKQQSDNIWLPAQSVRLDESWSELPKTIRVGDSLNRSLTLDVVGLKASQLPSLTTDNQTNFKVYADQPVTDEAVIQNGLRSQLQLQQAIIPTQTGSLTLPEMNVTWWNTETQSIETSTVSERTFTVLPALNSPINHVQNPSETPDQNNITNKPSQFTDVSRETNIVWVLVTVFLGLAWFITLWLWRKQNRELKARLQLLEQGKERTISPTEVTESTDNSDENPSKIQIKLSKKALQNPSFSKLCDNTGQQSANDFYQDLRKVLLDNFEMQSFAEIDYAPLKEAINVLESHLFKQTDLPDNSLENICQTIETFSEIQAQKSVEQAQTNKTKLASLYHR